MFRRLNFLLPDLAHAQAVVADLHQMGIDNQDIHAFSRNPLPEGALPVASQNQKQDLARKIEDTFWTGNLVFFLFCFLVLFIAIASGYFLTGVISLGLMIISFAIGNFFASYIPHVHINEFKHALSHNELLLTVDVPDTQLREVEENIHRKHPEVVEGGTSWTLKGVDI